MNRIYVCRYCNKSFIGRSLRYCPYCGHILLKSNETPPKRPKGDKIYISEIETKIREIREIEKQNIDEN